MGRLQDFSCVSAAKADVGFENQHFRLEYHRQVKRLLLLFVIRGLYAARGQIDLDDPDDFWAQHSNGTNLLPAANAAPIITYIIKMYVV